MGRRGMSVEAAQKRTVGEFVLLGSRRRKHSLFRRRLGCLREYYYALGHYIIPLPLRYYTLRNYVDTSLSVNAINHTAV